MSARNVLLRATEYYRQAFFFHRDDLDDDELRTAYEASVDAFRTALPLLDHRAEVLTDGLSGYLFTGDGDARRPTLLHIGGYDGTAEELYAAAGPALERGYAFAAVDGPGQGALLYGQRVPMRPDWEAVVPGMVDALTPTPLGRSRTDRAGRPLLRRPARPQGSLGGAPPRRDDRGPRSDDDGHHALSRLGDLAEHLDDPAADDRFESLLAIPSLRSFLVPRDGDPRPDQRARVLRTTSSATATRTRRRRSPARAS